MGPGAPSRRSRTACARSAARQVAALLKARSLRTFSLKRCHALALSMNWPKLGADLVEIWQHTEFVSAAERRLAPARLSLGWDRDRRRDGAHRQTSSLYLSSREPLQAVAQRGLFWRWTRA